MSKVTAASVRRRMAFVKEYYSVLPYIPTYKVDLWHRHINGSCILGYRNNQSTCGSYYYRDIPHYIKRIKLRGLT